MDKISTKQRSFWVRSMAGAICLALTLTTAAVFYQVCTYDFVNLDDPVYVYENLNIQAGITPKAIKWAFTTGYASNWHPLTWLSHMLDWQLFGLKAGDHHLTNLIFHIANTLLLFIVLKQMTHKLWQSAFVAALFALHPLHVESVAWVAERKDVLSTFFWMLTIWAYIRFVNSPKITSYLLVLVFFALGLMSKPMLVTLPFVLLLLDYWPLDRFSLKRGEAGSKYSLPYLLIEKAPLFAMTLVSCIVTFIIQREGGAMVPFTLQLRISNALVSYVEYIGKMIWPSRLAVFYPHLGKNISILHTVISVVLLLAVTILILRFAKNHRYLVTGWFWYLGTLVPVIGLVQVGEQALADRYTYIPLTGLFIIIAWGLPEFLGKWSYRKIALWTSSLIVLSVLAIFAHIKQQYWKNTLTLCEHALRVTDNNYQAHFCIAYMLFEQDRIEEAIRHGTEAVRINPNNTNVITMLGAALHRAGRIDEAIYYYKRALEIRPNLTNAHLNLAAICVNKGELDEAVRHYRTVLKTTDTIPIHNDLGYALLKLGRFEEAAEEYHKVYSATPNDPNVLNKFGYALTQAGKFDESILILNKAIQIAPDLIELRFNLGLALTESNKLTEAAKEYEKILLIQPQSATAHNGLGTVFFQQGKLADAVKEYRESLRIKPDDPNVLNCLGITLGKQGKFNEAIKCFTDALRIKPDFTDANTNLDYALAFQSNFDEVNSRLTELLRIYPNSAEAHYHLGQVLMQKGKINEAITHFDAALRLEPNWIEPMNNLAWFLSASKEITIHNPAKAVSLARRACELTNYKEPRLLDTLAVAYAAAGDFSKAIETAEKALELCQSPEQNTLKEEIESRLVLYKEGKSYIETQ
jgi:tetratricopeptide (TPR) repeat protein